MKATNSPVFSPFTSLTLKVTGIILTLSSLLNYIVLAIPFNPGERSWQINFTNQFVDRGILPMLGIALIVAGAWIGNVAQGSESEGKLWQDARFWGFALASLLGLMFLVLVPLHISNVFSERNQAFEQISQGATQEEQTVAARAQQIQALAKDPQQIKQLEEAIQSGTVQGQQLAQLQALRQQLQQVQQSPDAVNKEIEAAQTQIRTQRQQQEQQIEAAASRSLLQTGITSFLLAIGYIVIGWTGLRGLLGSPSRRRGDRW